MRVQLPLDLSANSQPEPDLAVVLRDPGHFKSHPSQALLVVEVADSTLDYDRETKKHLYLGAGIPEYWIVNVRERTVEVYREDGDRVYAEKEQVTSNNLPVTVSVAELFG